MSSEFKLPTVAIVTDMTGNGTMFPLSPNFDDFQKCVRDKFGEDAVISMSFAGKPFILLSFHFIKELMEDAKNVIKNESYVLPNFTVNKVLCTRCLGEDLNLARGSHRKKRKITIDSVFNCKKKNVLYIHIYYFHF